MDSFPTPKGGEATAILACKKGWLSKKGQYSMDGWKKRWFELTGDRLLYYDKPGGTQKGTVSLDGCHSIRYSTALDAKPHEFEIVNAEGRIYRLCIEQKEQDAPRELASWVAELERCAFGDTLATNHGGPGEPEPEPAAVARPSWTPSTRRDAQDMSMLNVSSVLQRDPSAKAEELWMKDATCTECCNCQAAFTIYRRRHHCRRCGQIFCGKCSALVVNGDLIGRRNEAHARVCDMCFKAVEAKNTHATLADATAANPKTQLSSFQPPTRAPSSGAAGLHAAVDESSPLHSSIVSPQPSRLTDPRAGTLSGTILMEGEGGNEPQTSESEEEHSTAAQERHTSSHLPKMARARLVLPAPSPSTEASQSQSQTADEPSPLAVRTASPLPSGTALQAATGDGGTGEGGVRELGAAARARLVAILRQVLYNAEMDDAEIWGGILFRLVVEANRTVWTRTGTFSGGLSGSPEKGSSHKAKAGGGAMDSAGDSIDYLSYVQVTTISGGISEDSCYVDGVVCSSEKKGSKCNIQDKRMSTDIKKPRILLLNCSLDCSLFERKGW